MTYHSYIFFNVRSSFSRVIEAKKKTNKDIFLEILQSNKSITFYTYSTLGFKTNTNMLIWFQADTPEAIQDLLNKLMHSDLGRHLKITYTLFGTARKTQYAKSSEGHLKTERKGKKYLIIYPFNKTQNWYMLDFETRRSLMAGHIKVGKKYPHIEQVLLYSYGIDDNEFIVSYETDDLLQFQTLVMELRSDKVREYTLKDTPIFTCIHKTPKKALDYL
jgi:chlorite dismutase